MLRTIDRPKGGLRAVLGVLIGILVLGGAIGTVVALDSPSPHPEPLARADGAASAVEGIRPSTLPSPQRTVQPSPAVLVPPPIGRTGDPESFARAAATALFAWDTTTAITQDAYAGTLLAVADPSGTESAGLAGDIGNYLPTPAAWATLRQYRTRQWLELTSSAIPTAWSQALVEAGPDGLAPGTTAYTIHGVRHRAGVWEGRAVSTAHPVAFTAFVVCAPSYPSCHLLRLSLPDQPLL